MEELTSVWSEVDGEAGEREVELRVRFRLTEEEMRFVRACASASDTDVPAVLDREIYWEDGDWAMHVPESLFARGAAIMNRALGPYGAASPAPPPFSIEVPPKGTARFPSFRSPLNDQEWAQAADRWREHLTPEGRDHFNLALGASLAMDGELCKRHVDEAAKRIVVEVCVLCGAPVSPKDEVFFTNNPDPGAGCAHLRCANARGAR